MKNELRSVAVVFLRAGNLTFGGGDAITALLQRELVHRRAWLTRDQYGLAQSLAKVTPGTAILAFCAATGWIVRRSAGALAAVLAVSVPSAAIAILLTMAFTSMSGSARALAVLGAVLAASVGLMWAAAWLLVKRELNKVTALRTVVLVSGVFIARWWSISPIEILAGAAIIGALWPCEENA
jgi:chromate transporter